MTVAELIDRLRGLPPALPVVLEGCDCFGDATGVEVVDEDHEGYKCGCNSDHPHALIRIE